MILPVLDAIGWHIPNAIAAFWGACVSLSYRRPTSFFSALAQLGVGTASGNYGAPAPRWFLDQLPHDAEPLLAFLIGLTAMHWLLPAGLNLLNLALARARRRIEEDNRNE